MTYRLGVFDDIHLGEPRLRDAIDDHVARTVPRLSRFWRYFRNPDDHSTGRRRLAQESGLPARLTGRAEVWQDDRSLARREVVIENDIAWRVQAMVDFVFGRAPAIRSTARSPDLAGRIEAAVARVLDESGGLGLLQDLALLAHVHGHADLLLRERGAIGPDGSGLGLELIEPTRGFAILDPDDYRAIHAYVIHFERAGAWYTEIVSGRARQIYHDEHLVHEEVRSRPWPAGQPPVVHVQNLSQPFRYEGLGEVEPLIPLQDELNTRLSDRASRVTFQSFKMYLAKGIGGFDRTPVGPGQVWSTDNPDAEIHAFGGDAHSPSEDAHIEQVREAIDKTSGVPPLAGGVVRARIGNLSSANALRVTLLSVLAKTARKRVAYGRGLGRAAELVLAALHDSGALDTSPGDRGISVVWPDPLPEDLTARIESVRAKERLGASAGDLLDELGHTADATTIE